MAKDQGLGFDQMITELRLGLPGTTITPPNSMDKSVKKRVFSEIISDDDGENSSTTTTSDDRKIQNKAQIVGWPPVCSFRKKHNNNVLDKLNGSSTEDSSSTRKLYVKVSMDGAPYLRKIDLNVHKGYSDLVVAFEKLFGCYGRIGKDSAEYTPIYADKDGDWMLVGDDVPWTMFTESCKRLRIMKRSDAKGLGLQY